MSSPSPGKRRMDTDVIKLYTFVTNNRRIFSSLIDVNYVHIHAGIACTIAAIGRIFKPCGHFCHVIIITLYKIDEMKIKSLKIKGR